MGRIFEFRISIFDWKKTSAAVVGGGDDGSRAGKIGGGEHGASDFFG